MSLVYLRYEFVFDPSETWQHLSQLDSDLYSWLKGKGFDAELIETPQNPDNTKMIFIKKSQDIVNPAPKMKSVNQQVAQIAPNRDFSGRYKGGSER